MRYLVTCNENSQQHLEDELRRIEEISIVSWLTEVEAVVETSMELDAFSQFVKHHPVVFMRHLFKIEGYISHEDSKVLYDQLNFDSTKSFSFQIRSPKHLRERGNTIRTINVDALIARGYRLDVRNPEMIVSMFFDEKGVYYGVGTHTQQLSKWSGGMAHYAMDKGAISRAEFKLKEALEVFEIPTKPGRALDLGAAPGGWTHVLVDNGYDVVSVDPALLDKRIEKLTGVTHVMESAQEYLKNNPRVQFDIIVNDMKMDGKQSINVLSSFASSLKQDGVGIITLKFAIDYTFVNVEKMLKYLRTRYEVVAARQLFHNRHEVTVYVKPKKNA